jgi:glycosyltransferase involved in cell wall biosynthesis
MKIKYLFREKRPGNFSIEELFGGIRREVSKTFETENYTCPSSSQFQNLKAVSGIGEADLYHITGDVNYLAFNLPSKKTIITVHDIGHFEMTLKGYKKSIYKQLWLNLPFKKVAKLTTISEFTKSRLVHHFNLPEDKIVVIPNPAPLHLFKPSANQLQNSIPKILQIGSGHNKNIENLIEAVSGMEVELMLLRKVDPVLQARLEAKKIKYQFYPNLTYEQVYQKYIVCDMLYFASNYEGFGVPILEAQAVGRPVLTSTVASMPEVAGKGAHLVDYRSVEEIKSGIARIISDNEYSQKLVIAGFENVERYSMQNTVNGYINLYYTQR